MYNNSGSMIKLPATDHGSIDVSLIMRMTYHKVITEYSMGNTKDVSW